MITTDMTDIRMWIGWTVVLIILVGAYVLWPIGKLGWVRYVVKVVAGMWIVMTVMGLVGIAFQRFFR